MTLSQKIYKEALIAWWICVIIAFFLWYRNISFDRNLCFVIFLIGLLNLLIYALASGGSESSISQLIFLSILLIPLVLSIGVFLYSRSESSENSKIGIICFGYILISLLSYLGALSTVFNSDNIFGVSTVNGKVNLTRNGESLLGFWGYLFMFLLILGFIILLAVTDFNAIGLYLVIGFIFAVFLYAGFTPVYWINSLPFVGLAFSFFVWFAPLININ